MVIFIGFYLFQQHLEDSLEAIHDVATKSLGSLCVTEKFRSLSVPLATGRFESARQKADLAATFLQDLGVAHHNGKHILIKTAHFGYCSNKIHFIAIIKLT